MHGSSRQALYAKASNRAGLPHCSQTQAYRARGRVCPYIAKSAHLRPDKLFCGHLTDDRPLQRHKGVYGRFRACQIACGWSKRNKLLLAERWLWGEAFQRLAPFHYQAASFAPPSTTGRLAAHASASSLAMRVAAPNLRSFRRPAAASR